MGDLQGRSLIKLLIRFYCLTIGYSREASAQWINKAQLKMKKKTTKTNKVF